MGGDRSRTEEAERIEITDRRGLVLLAGGADFVLRLGEVDDDGHAVPIGQLPGALQRRRIERVHRMRRDGGNDQVVVGELPDEALGSRQAFFRRLRVGHRELDDRLAEHAAKAGGLRGPGNLLLEVIHVDVGRRPRADHFERREPGAGAHERRRHGLRLGREDVFLQPVHQREIVGQAAIEHHRRVGMRVDEPRHDDVAARVDGVGGTIGPGDGRRAVDRDDVAAVDGHRRRRRGPAGSASIVTTVALVTMSDTCRGAAWPAASPPASTAKPVRRSMKGGLYQPRSAGSRLRRTGQRTGERLTGA